MSETLLGNEDVRGRLARLAALGRLHPCLLFEGSAGVGKSGTALWLAQVVNCQERPLERSDGSPEPCGRCWSCRKIPAGAHPDILLVGLDAERTAPIISVDQAREVTGRLRVRALQARHRFVIIDPADAMTVEAANALLKTFEEPPRGTGFILVSAANHRLISTVLSRSQRVRFGPVEERRLAAWLAERGVADPVGIARLSDGCPGRALALASGEAAAWREARDAMLQAMAGSLGDLFVYNERLLRGNRAAWTERVERTLDALTRLLRDALRHGGGDAGNLYNSDRPEVVRAWSEALGPAGVAALSAAVDRAREDMGAFVNPRLMLDALFTRVMTELGSARTAAAG